MLDSDLSPHVLSNLTKQQIERIGVIGSWNLSDVHARVVIRLGWADEQAAEAVEEYRKFIALVVLNPGKAYGMVEAVDEIWHQHLLNTSDYLAMCSELVGGVIHHEQLPLDATARRDLQSLREQTLTDLGGTFQGPISTLWSSANAPHAVAKCCNHIAKVADRTITF